MNVDKFQASVQIAFPNFPNKFEYYWLTIHDFWFSLSKKFDKPPSFLFPLQIENLSSAEKETQKLNSLLLETSKISGGHKIFIVSTNRVEIIQIYLALQKAQNNFNIKLSDYFEHPPQSIDIIGEISTGFINKIKQNLILKVTPNELLLQTNENENIQQVSAYTMTDILSISPKQNDLNCSHRVLLSFNSNSHDSSQKVVQDSNSSISSKEFSIPDSSQLEKLISSVLFFMSTSH